MKMLKRLKVVIHASPTQNIQLLSLVLKIRSENIEIVTENTNSNIHLVSVHGPMYSGKTFLLNAIKDHYKGDWKRSGPRTSMARSLSLYDGTNELRLIDNLV